MNSANSVQPHHVNGRTSGTSTPLGSSLHGSLHSLHTAGEWPVNAAHYADQFATADSDHDGLVNGNDIREPLLATGAAPNILGHIWALVDVKKSGQLNLEQFSLIMYLIEASKRGEQPPAELPPYLLPPSLRPPGQQQQAKYDAIFDSHGPVGGKLSGLAVRPMLVNSGLDPTSLANIWELSDQDKDGQLDKIEFTVALHLIYRTLQNEPLPLRLPPNLVHPTKAIYHQKAPPPHLPRPNFVLGSRAASVTSLDESGGYSPNVSGQRANSVQPHHVNGRTSGTSTPLGSSLHGSLHSLHTAGEWPVNAAHYADQFATADSDHDGLVNGNDIREPLLATGAAPNILGHIWAFVDVKKSGQLNLEQFSLIMYLIEASKRGEQPPAELPPYLLPPSLRPPGQQQQPEKNSVATPQLPEATSMEIKEALEGENEEMKELAEAIQKMIVDRRQTEENVAQLEADMTIKNSKIKNLQVELSTLENTVKQLERQKGEANRRLADFDTQISQLEAACAAQTVKKEETLARMEQIEKDELNGEESKSKDEEEMEALRAELAALEAVLNQQNVQANLAVRTREQAVNEIIKLEKQEKRDLLQEERLKRATEDASHLSEKLAASIEQDTVEKFVHENPGVLEQKIDQSLFSDDVVYEASTSSAAPNVPNPPSGAINGNGKQVPDPFAQADPFASSQVASGFPSDPFSGAFPEDAFAAGPTESAKAPPPRPAPPKSARQTPVNDPFSSAAPAQDNGGSFVNFADFNSAFN